MTYEPRHVPADTSIGYTDLDGNAVERHSAPLEDDETYHVITPRNQLEVNLLDSLEAPVARKAIAAEEAEAEPTPKRKAAASKSDGGSE